MSTAVLTNRLELGSVADASLNAAVRFWFAVTVLGQIAFAFVVASFYGMTAARGNVHGWNKFVHGIVPGDHMGNLALMLHLFSAVAVMSAGAVQLVPGVRDRFPTFHRWNGRFYLLTALGVSGAGLYMTWFRLTVGDLPQHIASSLNAVLIWLCGALALRYALARDFRTHRRWALRLFLVVSASWFIRIMLFLSLFLFQRALDPNTIQGPFFTFLSFAQYVVPLAVLEIYFYARDHDAALPRIATATLLFVLTLGMIGGLFAVGSAIWVPQVKAGYDPRISISQTLSTTIASQGVDRAVQQYHDLKRSSPAAYNFDEAELNALGYDLLRARKFPEAIRIFQLNIEAYPQAANPYDSLGEAYMNQGDRPLAIALYKKSLQLNPKNRNAVVMLQKLNAP
jgi:tetratricopeptide (TPR) repeat protein